MNRDRRFRPFSSNIAFLLIYCCLPLVNSGCGISATNDGQNTGGTGGTGGGGSAQHSVDLAWDPPPSSPVTIAGYNVYRASAGSSSFQLVNSSPESQTKYTDSNVTSGLSYSYYVESVDGSGTQSSPSNTVSVTIP